MEDQFSKDNIENQDQVDLMFDEQGQKHEELSKGEVDAESLQKHLDQIMAERDDLQNQVLRAWADLKNFRNRAHQEKEDLRKFASEKLVLDLLPVVDNFERTIKAIHANADLESVLQGIKMVERQLQTALQNVELTPIDPLGQPFDPKLHDAIVAEESSEYPSGTVLEVIELGYMLAGKIIRPSKVKVAK